MQPILKGIAIRTYKHGPMQTLNEANITCHKGVANDARGKPSKRQVTVLSEVSWQQVCEQLKNQNNTPQLQHLSWLTRRANLLISHKVFSAADIGSTLHIGQCVLEITQECDPCYKMDQQINGLQQLLAPAFTAGVCCKVLNGGTISLEDAVSLQPAPTQSPLL